MERISYNTAALAQEKRFNLPVTAFYKVKDFLPILEENVPISNYNGQIYLKSAPFQYELLDWLRNVHKVLIIVVYNYEYDSTPWEWFIHKLDENGKPMIIFESPIGSGMCDTLQSMSSFTKYEDALEDALTRGLKLIGFQNE